MATRGQRLVLASVADRITDEQVLAKHLEDNRYPGKILNDSDRAYNRTISRFVDSQTVVLKTCSNVTDPPLVCVAYMEQDLSFSPKRFSKTYYRIHEPNVCRCFHDVLVVRPTEADLPYPRKDNIFRYLYFQREDKRYYNALGEKIERIARNADAGNSGHDMGGGLNLLGEIWRIFAVKDCTPGYKNDKRLAEMMEWPTEVLK